MRELPARVFNLDRGLIHTFLDLTKRPGRTARDYVNGRRSPFINPLTYFLVAATIHLLGLMIADDSIRDHFKNQIDKNTTVSAKLSEHFGDDPGGTLATLYLKVIKQAYTYLFLFFTAIPFALFLRLLAGRLTPSYNLAEITIFAIYTAAHLVLLTGFLVPITGSLNPSFHAMLSMVIYAVYTSFAARGFFEGGFGPVWRTLLALAGGLGTFLVGTLSIFALLLRASLTGG